MRITVTFLFAAIAVISTTGAEEDLECPDECEVIFNSKTEDNECVCETDDDDDDDSEDTDVLESADKRGGGYGPYSSSLYGPSPGSRFTSSSISFGGPNYHKRPLWKRGGGRQAAMKKRGGGRGFYSSAFADPMGGFYYKKKRSGYLSYQPDAGSTQYRSNDGSDFFRYRKAGSRLYGGHRRPQTGSISFGGPNYGFSKNKGKRGGGRSFHGSSFGASRYFRPYGKKKRGGARSFSDGHQPSYFWYNKKAGGRPFMSHYSGYNRYLSGYKRANKKSEVPPVKKSTK